MDRYLCNRLNDLLIDRRAWLGAHPVDYSPHGVAKAYVISVITVMDEVLYRRRVSRAEFITQTELWDDIAEEIKLFLLFK